MTPRGRSLVAIFSSQTHPTTPVPQSRHAAAATPHSAPCDAFAFTLRRTLLLLLKPTGEGGGSRSCCRGPRLPFVAGTGPQPVSGASCRARRGGGIVRPRSPAGARTRSGRREKRNVSTVQEPSLLTLERCWGTKGGGIVLLSTLLSGTLP